MKNTINTTEVINRLKNEFGPVNYTVRDLGCGFEFTSPNLEDLYEQKNNGAEVKIISIKSNGLLIAQYGISNISFHKL